LLSSFEICVSQFSLLSKCIPRYFVELTLLISWLPICTLNGVYPKTAFKREPDTDPDIRNAFTDTSRIHTFGKICTFINLLSSEAPFLPSVP